MTQWHWHKVLKSSLAVIEVDPLLINNFWKDLIQLFGGTCQTENKHLNSSQHSFSLNKAWKGAIMQKVMLKKKNNLFYFSPLKKNVVK